MFNVLKIAGSGLTASSLQLSVTANNLANINTTQGVGGQPFRAQNVILSARSAPATGSDVGIGQGVQVNAIVPSQSALTTVYNPTSPLANAKGFVTYSNVSLQTEMPNLIQASSAYSANVTAFNAGKTIDHQAVHL